MHRRHNTFGQFFSSLSEKLRPTQQVNPEDYGWWDSDIIPEHRDEVARADQFRDFIDSLEADTDVQEFFSPEPDHLRKYRRRIDLLAMALGGTVVALAGYIGMVDALDHFQVGSNGIDTTDTTVNTISMSGTSCAPNNNKTVYRAIYVGPNGQESSLDFVDYLMQADVQYQPCTTSDFLDMVLNSNQDVTLNSTGDGVIFGPSGYSNGMIALTVPANGVHNS